MQRQWLREVIEAFRRALMVMGLILFVVFGMKAMGRASNWQEVTGEPHIFPLGTGPVSGLQASLQGVSSGTASMATYVAVAAPMGSATNSTAKTVSKHLAASNSPPAMPSRDLPPSYAHDLKAHIRAEVAAQVSAYRPERHDAVK